MTKALLLSLVTINLFASDIPIDFVKKHKFAKSIDVNAKIIQLSNAKQSIMSLLDGHIEKYYVKEGDKIKRNQPIALIDSIALSDMTSKYLSLKKQFNSLRKNFQATKALYKKGLTSLQELNTQKAKQDEMISKINRLKSQLQTLGIDAKKLKEPTSEYILYSHNDGVISEILQPLHSVISQQTQIINVVKEQSFYLKSFVPLKYAPIIKTAKRATLHYMDNDIPVKIDQVLPRVDEKTQRIVLLSNIEKRIDDLFIGAYTAATIYLAPNKEYLAIKKTALSFFNNEWVVFVPKDEHKDHDNHDDHANHQEIDEHQSHDDHNDHTNHQDHSKNHEESSHTEHEEGIPYEPRIVKIIETNDELVAVEGLKEAQAYVSDKAYYIKSLLLKSSLGGHGH